MIEHDNIETVRRFYAAGPSDNDSLRHQFAAPDIVWHVPGHNRIARDYCGLQDVFETMGRAMQPLDEWSVDVESVMANRGLVLAFVAVRARRGACTVECRGGHVFRFDGSRIAEAWGFVEDQEGLDELFDS